MKQAFRVAVYLFESQTILERAACLSPPKPKRRRSVRTPTAFQDGATPESIIQRYSTLSLPDVYAVVAYYLRHPSEMESYLAGREQQAEHVRERINGQQGDLSAIRARLAPHRSDSHGCAVG